ncbi:MAG: succinate dehydrogenase cytochrome b subunit [Planctomycetota bacterium]|nr:succinate dehydrogenase cytochrome b subunit [Planctomycetota bacterium]
MKRSIAVAARSTIGAKGVMAATGVVLLLFVIGHMVGNLQVFAGPEKLNAYAAFLQGLGPALWVIRLVLLACLVLHVWAAVVVTRRSREARPVPYALKVDRVTSYAARTMIWSGVLVLAFVVYHLLHFTVGAYDPAEVYGALDAAGRHDVYSMVIEGFRHVPTTIAYVIAQVILCLHIQHGASSMVQTLGMRTKDCATRTDWIGPGLAALLLIGNLSMPLAIVTGFIGGETSTGLPAQLTLPSGD